MKKLLTFLSLLAFTLVANATKYAYAKVVLTDGTSRIGLVETSLDNDYVRFKSADGAEPEKIAADGIKTVAYLKEDQQTTVVEYDRIKVYFADYPELAEKIKSKEYTWKNLVPVVKEYNTWAAANKK
jgi:hypothetical protein